MPDSNAIRRVPRPDSAPSWGLRLRDRLGLLEPVEVLVYRSYGTSDLLHLRGRVVEQRALEGTSEESSVLTNLMNALRRFSSAEVPGARIRATFRGRRVETQTDKEGYFVVDIHADEELEPGWHEVEIELVESVGQPAHKKRSEPVLIPHSDAQFGVISDLDDTVIKTHSTDLAQQLAIVFGKSAHDRVAFPGVPALYRALQRGPDDSNENPIFYVSRSGWNLYDLFEQFAAVNEIPKGPLFLTDVRVFEGKSAVIGSDNHKYDSIDLLLRVYPELSFILIGDSGMHDPELYRELVRQHPGRILAIYIHDVSEDERDREVEALAKELETEGVPLVHREDTIDAAEHAARCGFISERGLAEVREETARQENGGADKRRD